jgi:hypothetical protein
MLQSLVAENFMRETPAIINTVKVNSFSQKAIQEMDQLP